MGLKDVLLKSKFCWPCYLINEHNSTFSFRNLCAYHKEALTPTKDKV